MESRTAHMKYLEIGAQPGFPNTQSSASRLCWQESLVLVMNDQTSKSAGTLAIEETFTNDEPLDKTTFDYCICSVKNAPYKLTQFLHQLFHVSTVSHFALEILVYVKNGTLITAHKWRLSTFHLLGNRTRHRFQGFLHEILSSDSGRRETNNGRKA